MNKYWPSVPRSQHWRERLRRASPNGHFSSVAWNTRQSRPITSTYQIGGCSASILGQLAHGAQSSGQDPTGLGRFAWCRIQGRARSREEWKEDDGEDDRSRTHDLIVVSAYRSCGPGMGTNTVWAQQRDYFLAKGIATDPREMFVRDLIEAVEEWTRWGCEIIVGIDANEDLSKTGPNSFRGRMMEAGLQEAILSRHRSSPPATQIDNTRCEPIDGVFVTPGVHVKAGGYYGFYEVLDTDHRGLWIDIDVFKTLGGHRPKPTHPKRRLITTDRATRRRYVKLAERGYQRYNIFGRLKILRQEIANQEGYINPQQEERFNRIHSDARTIRRTAEQQCRKIKGGGQPWSPKGQETRDRILLWKILIDRLEGRRVPSRKLRRLLTKTGLPEAYKLKGEVIRTRLSEDLRLKREQAKDGTLSQWRREYLEARSKATNQAFRKSKTRYNRERKEKFQRMRQREETRRRRKAQGKGFSGGLKMIQVEHTQSDGSVRLVSCSERALVEDGCMMENKARYDQTRSPFPTPPMKFPLYQEFTGPMAEEYMDELLAGKWEIPSSLRAPTKSFLKQCRSGVEPTPLIIDRHSNSKFWQKNPEMKGSEPHGLHNGHYKAASFSPLLSSCDAMCRDIPMVTGIAPNEWRNLMNFAIEKKPGDFRVKKMRTIQLMDAEFQANNKLVGKRAMEIAEDHSLIPPGQCGSRKKHQAIDLALSKQLVWDQLLLRRQAAGWILNDAKSCFDRVVHWVAQVALRRFGIPWATVDMMFKTLRMSTHRVRTGFGDSERSFEPPTSVPFQGSGQGNGAGPTVWVAISSILIDTMIAAGHGFQFLNVLDYCLKVAECFCFVDDTDLVEAAVCPEVVGEFLMQQVQKALTLWSECVLTTGGAINPEKTFWWFIDFQWDSRTGVWKYRKNQEVEGSMWIRGLDGRPEQLVRLEPDTTEKTLGIQMSPQFNPDPQKQAVIAKAIKWAATIKKGTLLPYDAFPLLTTTILKSLEYPMPLMHLSKTEWTSVMKPVLRAILPKAKVSANFPREVVYGPMKYQGLGIPHPSGIQLIRHLDMFLRHLANQTTTGSYLEACLQGHQLETGTSYGILQQDYSNTAILASNTWVKRNWLEFEEYDIHLETMTPTLPYRCQGDRLLVDVFIEAEVDQQTLKWLDWCRMYLNVSTVSDLVTADGAQLHLWAWNGRCAPFVRSAVPEWPRAHDVSRHRWDIWRQVLSTTLMSSPDSLTLAEPLGPWHDDIFLWKWLFSPSQLRLYARQGHGWVCCRRLRLQSEQYPRRNDKTDLYAYFQFRGFYRGALPLDVQRVTVNFIDPNESGMERVMMGDPRRSRLRHLVQITGVGIEEESETQSMTSILGMWESFKAQCDDHYGWVPENISIEGSESRLLEALKTGQLRVISDGSYKDGVGSAATQLRTKSGSDIIWILCQVTGPANDQSAYRSELMGIFAGLQIVDWMRKILIQGFLSKWKPTVIFACDGKAALMNSFDTWPLKPTCKQFDLVSSLRHLRRNAYIDCRSKHVKGHQDDETPTGRLSWWALRNIECDARAKLYRRQITRERRQIARHPRFFSEPATLFIQGVKQTRLDPDSIMELVTLPPLMAYWERKGRVTTASNEEIDWSRVGKMMKALPSGLQRWTTKHAVGMCGVGKWKYRWKYASHDQCPRCGMPEDHLHVTRCPDESAEAEWNDRVANFRTWLRSSMTDPSIQLALSRLLLMVRGPSKSVTQLCQAIPTSDPAALRAAVSSQLVIGVQGLLEGLLSKRWTPIQTAHYRSRGSRRTGEVWYSQASAQLIWIGFHMWQHRNGVQHSDLNSSHKQRHRDVNLAIREQFELGYRDLPKPIQTRLRCPRLDILRLPLPDKEQWVRNIRAERRLARRILQRQQQALREFFHQLPSTRPRKRRRISQTVPMAPLTQASLPFLPSTARTTSRRRRGRNRPLRPLRHITYSQTSLTQLLPLG